ncbi:hypothetical protein ACE6H2_005731 [Prunus campanulata]
MKGEGGREKVTVPPTPRSFLPPLPYFSFSCPLIFFTPHLPSEYPFTFPLLSLSFFPNRVRALICWGTTWLPFFSFFWWRSQVPPRDLLSVF